MTTDYYLCPFCFSSSLCDGPHIEQKDFAKFRYWIKLLQADIAELAKEVILEQGENMDYKALATYVEQKLLDRDNI